MSDEFVAYLSSAIARYKLPQQAYKLDHLPRNGVGKVLKYVLQEHYATSLATLV